MITVWLATFPAMFYGMYNVGHRNEILAFTDFDPSQTWRLYLKYNCWF